MANKRGSIKAKSGKRSKSSPPAAKGKPALKARSRTTARAVSVKRADKPAARKPVQPKPKPKSRAAAPAPPTRTTARPATPAPAPVAVVASRPAASVRPAAATRPEIQLTPPPARIGGPASPGLADAVAALRDAVLATKLTAEDPWTYTGKARGWTERAVALLEDIARSGEGASLRARWDALRQDIESDPDFREACRRA